MSHSEHLVNFRNRAKAAPGRAEGRIIFTADAVARPVKSSRHTSACATAVQNRWPSARTSRSVSPPQFAKRTAHLGHPSGGGLGKPISQFKHYVGAKYAAPPGLDFILVCFYTDFAPTALGYGRHRRRRTTKTI